LHYHFYLWTKGNQIVIGKIDSVYSGILKEKRKLWIYTPDMTSGNQDPSQRYPVLYLLDGDAHFVSVVGLIQQLSQSNGNSILPEMIVVGITNTDRTRDLTPTHVKSDLPAMDSNFSKTSGGGKNFLAFIENELFPHIDSAYKTAPYKVLVGHSFGGLAAIDALTNHTKLFNAYLAIDPSMWYDQERYLAATQKKFLENKYDGKRLYIGIANTMPQGMSLDKMKIDTSASTRHIRSIFKLDKFLRANPQNNLKYYSRYYSDDSDPFLVIRIRWLNIF
jgi:predicted alpha/beta superfamily hydrolase